MEQSSMMNASNNINGIGNCPSNEVYTLKHQDLVDVHEEVTRKIVQELRGFDNIYYEVCNEPYTKNDHAYVSLEWQYRIVDVIMDVEIDFPFKHLISLNIANGSVKVTDCHSGVSILNFHYCNPPDAVALNYDLNMVIGENETGFHGSEDVTYRSEGWDFILAGGALYNNLDYSFTSKYPDGSFLDYQSPGGGGPALRKQLNILKDFIHSFDFIRMAPNNAAIKGGILKDATARALVEPGRQYALYINGGNQVDLKLELTAGIYTIEWIDTKTGEVTKHEILSHQKGVATVCSPEYSEDIALRIRLSQ